MPAQGGRWGRFWEQRARQLQRQVQAKDERIVDLETEKAVLHLRLAQGGGASSGLCSACGQRARPPRGGPRWALLQLRPGIQTLKQDIKALHAPFLEVLRNCWDHLQAALSEVAAGVQRAQLAHQALLTWRCEAGRLERRLRDADARYLLERRRRRELHNRLVELRGNIRVHCRIRPLLPFDEESDDPASGNSSEPAEVVQAVDEVRGKWEVPLEAVSGWPRPHKVGPWSPSYAVTCHNLRRLFLSRSGSWSGSFMFTQKPRERLSGTENSRQSLEETVLVKCDRPAHPLINKTYRFERVYGPAESQQVVFEDVRPLLTSLLDGYDVCIMAYGQTGCGKSCTVLGPHATEEPHGRLGVLPRAAAELFRLISENPSRSLKVDVSIVEIYNNDIFDLLAKDGRTAASGPKREALTSEEPKQEVRPLTRAPVHSAAEFMALAAGSLRLRAKLATSVHASSSRSHLIITATLTTATEHSSPGACHPWGAEQQSRTPPPEGRRRSASGGRNSLGAPGAQRPMEQVHAKLQLVDLAGSECVGASGVTGPALRETSLINRSLAALADVLAALAERRGHVPYRNSKLTHFLQNVLGGDAKLLVILCVSPCLKHVAETLRCLGFGVRASQVQRSPARGGRPALRKPR